MLQLGCTQRYLTKLRHYQHSGLQDKYTTIGPPSQHEWKTAYIYKPRLDQAYEKKGRYWLDENKWVTESGIQDMFSLSI